MQEGQAAASTQEPVVVPLVQVRVADGPGPPGALHATSHVAPSYCKVQLVVYRAAWSAVRLRAAHVCTAVHTGMVDVDVHVAVEVVANFVHAFVRPVPANAGPLHATMHCDPTGAEVQLWESVIASRSKAGHMIAEGAVRKAIHKVSIECAQKWSKGKPHATRQ